METEQAPSEQAVGRFANLHKVTPLSKYLAMGLFVILPFVGGWVGYQFALQKQSNVEPDPASRSIQMPKERSAQFENREQSSVREQNEENQTDEADRSYGNIIDGLVVPERFSSYPIVFYPYPLERFGPGKLVIEARWPESIDINGNRLPLLAEHHFTWQDKKGRVLHVCDNANEPNIRGYTYLHSLSKDGQYCISLSKIYINMGDDYYLIDESQVNYISDLRQLREIQFAKNTFPERLPLVDTATSSDDNNDLLMLHFIHDRCDVAFSENCFGMNELTHLVSLADMRVTKYDPPLRYLGAFVGGQFIWNKPRTAFVLTQGDLGAGFGFSVFRAGEIQPVHENVSGGTSSHDMEPSLQQILLNISWIDDNTVRIGDDIWSVND